MDQAHTDFERYKGAKVTVMGLGTHGGGAGATKFFADLGADVTVTDLRGKRALASTLRDLDGLDVRYVLGRHIKRDFESADLVLVNPAVPDDSPYVRAAQKAGVHTDTALNFFMKNCPCPVIGVTGTNGKSTTTTLLGDMLRCAGINARVGGNLGGDVLNWLFELQKDDLVVLEMSSFQLKALDADAPSPQTAVLTNFAPNHLDRHVTLDDYYRSKARIFGGAHPAKRLVVNANDPTIAKWVRSFGGDCLLYDAYRDRPTGLTVDKGWVQYDYKGLSGRLFPVADVGLTGEFNLENAMAAAGAALLEGCSPKAIQTAVQNFRGLPHRLEFVGKWRDVSVYNDSKSTNPTSTLRAIDAVAGPVIVVIGGSDKDLGLEEFAAELCRCAKAVVCYGEGGNRAFRAMAETRGTAPQPLLLWKKPFEESVERALSMASPGDTVLLSPAFASFDQFSSFEARGDAFRTTVEAWGRRGERPETR